MCISERAHIVAKGERALDLEFALEEEIPQLQPVTLIVGMPRPTSARRILKEITDRLRFLNNVGLEYLNLSRNSGTLSGGESQRIRLASQIGSGLTGVL